MTLSSNDFASLVASKLCHDLLNPVGAISNGLELYGDEKDVDMKARCLELVAQSTQAAAAKLKFYRLAFGAAGGFGDMIPASEAQDAFAAMVDAGKISLTWLVRSETLPKPAAKIMLLLGQIAADALVRGGTLAIAFEQGAASLEIGIMAQGERLIIPEEIRKTLAYAPDQSASSRTIGALFARELADQQGGRLMMADDQPGALTLGVSLIP